MSGWCGGSRPNPATPNEKGITLIDYKGKNPSERLELATVSEAADYMSVTPKTIHAYFREGRLTRYSMGPRMVRVDINEVNDRLRNYGALTTP
jgi:excisionase family DNA binding protein